MKGLAAPLLLPQCGLRSLPGFVTPLSRVSRLPPVASNILGKVAGAKTVVSGSRGSREPNSFKTELKQLKRALRDVGQQAGSAALMAPLAIAASVLGGAILVGATGAMLLTITSIIMTMTVAVGMLVFPPLMVGALLPILALFALLASPATFALLSLAPILILAIAWRLRPQFGPTALDWLINDIDEGVEDMTVLNVTVEEVEEEEEDLDSTRESRRRLEDWDTKFRRRL